KAGNDRGGLVAQCRLHSTGSRSRFARGGRRWFGAARALIVQVKRGRMGRIVRKLSPRCGLVVGGTGLCFALAASRPSARSESSEEPRYAPSGDLLLRNGFDTWVFVGSNLGLSYTPDAAAAASAPPPRAPGSNFTTCLSTERHTIISPQMVGFPRGRFW